MLNIFNGVRGNTDARYRTVHRRSLLLCVVSVVSILTLNPVDTSLDFISLGTISSEALYTLTGWVYTTRARTLNSQVFVFLTLAVLLARPFAISFDLLARPVPRYQTTLTLSTEDEVDEAAIHRAFYINGVASCLVLVAVSVTLAHAKGYVVAACMAYGLLTPVKVWPWPPLLATTVFAAFIDRYLFLSRLIQCALLYNILYLSEVWLNVLS